jgi:hypothetical protein
MSRSQALIKPLRFGSSKMGDFDRRTQTKLDLVLELSCRKLPHGGDHETRRYVAEHLIEAALSGKTEQTDLDMIAREALLELAPQLPYRLGIFKQHIFLGGGP